MTTTCQAIVETTDANFGAVHYTRQGVVSMGSKGCSRKAVAKVGQLCLCKAHAKMALEGLVSEDGTVAAKADVATVRRYPAKFPGGLYKWAKGLSAEVL